MAFTTFLLTVSMVAVASGGFRAFNDDDNPFAGFPSMMHFPFPKMPKVPMFFPPFPTMFSIPTINMADIATAGGKGGSFNGIAVSSKTQITTDKDGNPVKTGGTTILVNTDGKLTVQQTGDSPPEIPIKAPPSLDFDAPKLKHKPFKHNFASSFASAGGFANFDNFNLFPHNFARMKPIEPIDPEKILKYEPGEGETYLASGVQSRSYSSNVNGKVKKGGSVVIYENDNGKVKKEKIDLHGGDPE